MVLRQARVEYPNIHTMQQHAPEEFLALLEARTGLLAEFRRLVEEEVTAEELDRARTYAIGSWKIRQSSGAAVLAEIADAWIHDDLAGLARYPDDLAAVTPARMRAAAERWFDPTRRVEGIVRGRARG